MCELDRRVGEKPAPIARMVAAFTRIHREVDRERAAAAEKDRRPVGREPWPVRADQHVGAQQAGVLGAEFAQARRAHFLAHLDQPFGVEAEAPACRHHRRHRGEIDRVLALVVRRAAAVIAAVTLGQRPRRKTVLPRIVEAADRVAVAIAEHGRQALALDALGIEERPFGLRVREHAARKAHRLERGAHLGFDVAREVGGAVGVLTLGRDRDAARKVRLEGAGVEIRLRARNRILTAHDTRPNVSILPRSPRPARLTQPARRPSRRECRQEPQARSRSADRAGRR